MPVDTQQILNEAEKIGKLVAQHPAVEKFKQAQDAVANDPEAGRLLSEFDRQLETLARQEQSGQPLTDAQRQQFESLQSQIVSHIKIKSLNMAQVELVDLLRKINQAIHKPVQGAPGTASAGSGPQATPMGPRLAT